MGSVDDTTEGEALVNAAGRLTVPLEQGERIVFFARPHHARHKLVYVVVGVLLAPLVLGFGFLAYGLLYQRYNLRFVAVTNRRVIVQRGTKPARWLRLAEVMDLRARRGGPSAHGAMRPRDATAALDKTDPRHWTHAHTIVVQGHGGALSIDDSVALDRVGPAIAHALRTNDAA